MTRSRPRSGSPMARLPPGSAVPGPRCARRSAAGIRYSRWRNSMDEMRMVRVLYPEPAPPTAQEVAQARALLAGSPRRAPRQLQLRWGLGGAAMAGAAAVAVALAT